MIDSTINAIQAKVWELFLSEQKQFSGKGKSELNDFIHRAEELSRSPDYSVRVAAEIVRSSCLLELEKL